MPAWLATAGVLAAVLAAAWGLRLLAHHAILRGLRAPRVPHGPGPLLGHQLGTRLGPEFGGLCGPPVQACRIAGPGGRSLHGWLVMPPTPPGAPPVPAVLAMHGWGANASAMAPLAPPLQDAGLAVLLLDARCHGLSDDEAFTSMPRFAEDMAAGLAWLRLQPGIDAQRLSLVGHSVGAAAALLHASQHPDVCAVVSISAFAHPREVMRRFMAEKRVPYPVLGWYVLRHVQAVIGARFDDIAPLHTLPRVRCPVLLVHGRGDHTVPFADAQRLQAVAPQTRLLAVQGDHDLRLALQDHAGELIDFLRTTRPAGVCQIGSSMPDWRN